MNISWSSPMSFKQSEVEKIPNEPGVYEFLQSDVYHRYEGTTRILKIGKSEKSLREEILNHFQRHTVANRLSRIRKMPTVSVTVIFAVMSAEDADRIEKGLSREFEDKHWDLPVLNSQRGYARSEDNHYAK
jgi:excinuclease UvrABC nuclease subunit